MKIIKNENNSTESAKRILYIDCNMGAAGDMLAGALSELLPDRDAFLEEFDALGLESVRISLEKSVKCGISGTHFNVEINGEHETSMDVDPHFHEDHSHMHSHGWEAGEHHHRRLVDIEHIVRSFELSEKVKADILAVYDLIAEAESHVHGETVLKIHFHEVGDLDAIADITAVCMLMDRLSPDIVSASPVNVGSGQVRCAHGILPVPAPATAYLLRGIPVYSGNIRCELCTPTGAALLKYFCTEFGDMPAMVPKAQGYGMGTKDLPSANCVRITMGTEIINCENIKDKAIHEENTYDENRSDEIPGEEDSGENGSRDHVWELKCNIDDMSPEKLGYAMDRIYEAGAREVFYIPCTMKKNRPGVLLTALADESTRQAVAEAIFFHTNTIGIRENRCSRYILDREIVKIDTPWGQVGKKISKGYGAAHEKYEFDDVASIALKCGKSLEQLEKLIHEADSMK